MEPRYIPLKTDGSKSPAVSGWAAEDYACTLEEALAQSSWVGLRADGLVIADCDSTEAADHWRAETGTAPPGTETPRGRHYYYLATPGSPTGPAVDVLGGGSKVDIRAGRGSYVVVAPSPGYTELEGEVCPFDPRWVPARREPPEGPGSSSPDSPAGWSKIPDGSRNVTLMAFAGAFRRQGMDQAEIGAMLWAMNNRYCVPPLDAHEVKTIAWSASRYEVSPDIAVIVDDDDREHVGDIPILRAKDFGPPPPKSWLWEPFIPDMTLTLVSGREGIGKGMFCAYVATSVLTGVRPGTGEKVDPKPVLWLTAEDDPHLDIWPRMRAAGWDPEQHGELVFMDPGHVLKLPEDTQRLEAAIRELEPGLVIMDPGRAYFGRRDGERISFNEESDVRPAMQQLLRVSSTNRIPMIFVGHWRKGEGAVRDMTSGSGAWRQVVRIAIDFAESPDEQQKAFAIGKNNLGPKGHVTGYHMEPVDEYETARFVNDGPLPFADLDRWIDATKNTRVVLDHEADLLDYLCTFEVGKLLPNRTTMHDQLGISEGKLKVLLADLREQGRVELRQGIGLVWLG